MDLGLFALIHMYLGNIELAQSEGEDRTESEFLTALLREYAIPLIGHIPLLEVQPGHLLDVLAVMEDQGCDEESIALCRASVDEIWGMVCAWRVLYDVLEAEPA